MPAYSDRDPEQWDATSTAAPFDPRAEIPALLARIKELSLEFTCDGIPGTEFEREARELRNLVARLDRVAHAVTACSLVNER